MGSLFVLCVMVWLMVCIVGYVKVNKEINKIKDELWEHVEIKKLMLKGDK